VAADELIELIRIRDEFDFGAKSPAKTWSELETLSRRKCSSPYIIRPEYNIRHDHLPAGGVRS